MRIFVQHSPRKIPQPENTNIPNAENIHTRYIGVWIKPLYMRNKFCSTSKIKNGELDKGERSAVGKLISYRKYFQFLTLPHDCSYFFVYGLNQIKDLVCPKELSSRTCICIATITIRGEGNKHQV